MNDDNNVKKQFTVLCTTLFLIVGFSAKSLASNSPATDLDSTLLAIYDQYEAKKYEPALHRCNLLVQKYPLSTAAQDLKVSLLLAMRKPVGGDYAKATALPCKTAMDFFMAGVLDLISRQYQKSLDHLSEAIELNPKEVRFYCARARLLDLRSEQKKVIQDLNKALEIEPKYAPAHRLKAFMFRRAGNSNAALTEINDAIALSPMPVDYWSRATIYGSMKKFDMALKDWNEYVKTDPSAEAYTGRAAVLLKNGKLKEGLYDLDKAVGLAPKWYLPHRLRAEAYLALQEPAKAVKDLEVMQKYVRETERIGGKQSLVDRQSELTREELIKTQQISYEVHSRLGNLHAAAGDLEELLKISPHDKWALSRLQNKTEKVGPGVQAGKSDGGILSTTDDLSKSGNEKAAREANEHLFKARQYDRTYEVDKALIEYSKAIAINPTLYAAYYDRAWLYQQDNQIDNAIADYQRAATLTKDPSEVLHQLAKLQFKLKHYTQTIAICSQCLQKNPSDIGVLSLRAESKLKIGLAHDALADAEAALKLSPSSMGLLASRASINLSLHENRKAIADLDRALAVEPEKRDWLKMRAEALEKCGEKALAARDLATIKSLDEGTFGTAPFRAELRGSKN